MAGKALKTITHEDVVITLPVAITLPDTYGLLALCKRGDLRLVQENALRQVGATQLHGGHQVDLARFGIAVVMAFAGWMITEAMPGVGTLLVFGAMVATIDTGTTQMTVRAQICSASGAAAVPSRTPT